MISSKPTLYSGILFRSKLEASWAAMFDLLEWPWIYEPEECGGYIPDFLIRGHVNDWYAEVKSSAEWLQDRQKIIAKAAPVLRKSNLIILTGEFDRSMYFGSDRLAFGTLYDGGGDDQAHLHFVDGKYDFLGGWGDWTTRLDPRYDGNAYAESGLVDGADLLKLWSRARNQSQWRPAA